MILGERGIWVQGLVAVMLFCGLFVPASAGLPRDRFSQEGNEYEHEGARYRSHKMRGMWFDVLVSHQPGCEIDPKLGLENGYVPIQSPECREKASPTVFLNPDAVPFRYPDAKPQTHSLDLSRLDVAVADAYFKWLCENEAGTWIYKTVSNVEGVFAMRNRPNYGYPGQWERWDRYYMEDPWGESRFTEPQTTTPFEVDFLMPRATIRGAPSRFNAYDAQNGYEFYERPVLPQEAKKYPGFKFLRFKRPWPLEPSYGSDYKEPWYGRLPPPNPAERPRDARKPRQVIVYASVSEHERMTYPKPEPTNTIQSHYGFFWRGVERTPYDRPLGIGGGEEFIVDLKTNQVLALRREFVRMPGGKPSWDDKLDWTWAKSCKGEIHKILTDVLIPVDPIKARGIDLGSVPTPFDLEQQKRNTDQSNNTSR